MEMLVAIGMGIVFALIIGAVSFGTYKFFEKIHHTMEK